MEVMTWGKCTIIAVLLLAAGCLCCPSFGDDGESIPSIMLPPSLHAYSDEGRVVEAVTTVIGVLGTAKFEEPDANSPLSKPPCNAPEVLAFYRGMTLMQAGYFMFINKVERGF